jgi:Flp pilus assembly protein TadD
MKTTADDPNAQFLHGNSLMQAGRFADAATAYQRILVLNPLAPRVHNNLAVALAEQGLLDRAVLAYREALRQDPNYAEAHYNLGNALHALGRHDEAMTSYDRALELAPGWPSALLNRGRVFASCGQQALAEASYRHALAGRPDYPEAHNNLGLALALQGHHDSAMQHFNRALELAPQFADAHSNRAQLRLLLGQLKSGWSEYEWRCRLSSWTLPALALPRWSGEVVPGTTVLLRAEQGFGDTLQFIRFALPLHSAGLRVVVECQPALASLLARVAGVDAVVARPAAPPACDVQIPMASLPGMLGVFDTAAIPAPVPYLQARPELVAHWRDRLSAHRGRRVGIVWSGSPGHPQNCHRSIPPEHFSTLGKLPGVVLINIQFGQSTPPGVNAMRLDDVDTGAPSFEDTAAIITNLDLLISCDTVFAHLAGALGVPVWIALSVATDWRWLLEQDDSPWYPSARLFRQTRLDDWAEVFVRIKTALEQRWGSSPSST